MSHSDSVILSYGQDALKEAEDLFNRTYKAFLKDPTMPLQKALKGALNIVIKERKNVKT